MSGRIIGVCLLTAVIIVILVGSILGGLEFIVTGDYTITYIAAIISGLLGLAAFFFSFQRKIAK